MRILHTLDNSNRGGIQELILNLNKYSRHTHEFVAADGSMADEIRTAGMKLWNTYVTGVLNYDVVVGHTVGGWDGTPGAEFAHSFGAKFVECMHSNAPSPTPAGMVDGFIALSNIALGINGQFKNGTCIYGILNAGDFKPYNPDNRLIGRMSRLAQEKSPLDFIMLARTFPYEQFICAGDGALYQEMIDRRPDNLQMAGWIREKGAFYGRLRLFVFSTYDECCCMSVAQAQAAGVPVICSDTAALRETTGGHAMFCKDVVSMAGEIQAFLNSDAVRADYYTRAASGLEWAKNSFDKAVTVEKWDRYLESL